MEPHTTRNSGKTMTVNYYNYFLPSKNSRLIHGHLESDKLMEKIINHDNSPAYCCYFDLDYNYLKLEYDTGKVDRDGKKIYEYKLNGQKPSHPDYKCNGKSFSQYEGICRPSLESVSFDFDGENLEDVLEDVQAFLNYMANVFGVETSSFITFFSGSKGFHVLIPFDAFPFEPNEYLPNQIKDLVKHLKETFPTLDDSIYNYNRKFRVPFSKHEKTGLYKNIIDDVLCEEVESIKSYCESPRGYHFLSHGYLDTSDYEKESIKQIFEEAKRKSSYVVEKDRAGTIEAPSPFEKFDGKLCIQKMLETRCDDIGRNNAAMRIVNDYYRTGKPQKKCEEDLFEWSRQNNLPMSEVSTIISNIYERGANYNFGCQDECKSVYCSAKCPIWKKLDPDKRPVTVDQPLSAETSTKMKNEFVGVTWLMESLFGCTWNEDKKAFEGGLIVKQDASHLFYYKDKHWQYLDESKVHILKTKLNANYENKLSTRKLDAVFKMFVLYVPEVPEGVDLFAPRNDKSNFLDGTLHLERSPQGQFELNFKEHDKMDFCASIIELNYRDYANNPTIKNEVFENWLYEYLQKDDEAFKLIGEMFGASLLPRFPQFFVLIGASGTGKSTTIKVLKQLHKNDKNISGVSPDKFHGFHMASMIGKLINIVGDIKTNCRIDDDIVKQVDDQEVVRIEIKSQADVYTKLPALHIFGANKMPKTSEGYSGAMKRRFSIINFDKKFTGKKNTEIAKDMFEANPLGVLAFALRGLERLIVTNNGEYTSTVKSQTNVDTWTKKDDMIFQFINEVSEDSIDIGGKNIMIRQEENGEIDRVFLWQCFKKWQVDAIEQRNQIGKINFFNRLSDANFVTKRRKAGRVIVGISEVLGDDESI